MNNGNIRNLSLFKNHNLYHKMISKKNLFISAYEFRKDKKKKKDVIEFFFEPEKNLLLLHQELKNFKYHHGHYISFLICDPKLRRIHKAPVKDRILHHALVRITAPIFEKSFIFDSYSSRKNKGTHRAILKFKEFAWRLSKNNTRPVWVLKCDIKKFFDSVDHRILIKLISKKIVDQKVLWLIKEIIRSFNPDFLKIKGSLWGISPANYFLISI